MSFDNFLRGGEGDDILTGGFGDDLVFGFGGNDRLSGRLGADILLGGRGNDVLLGGGGRDVLDGGTGDDLLLGGRGGDTLIGGTGTDSVDGGLGRDRLVVNTIDAGDIFDGGTGGFVLTNSNVVVTDPNGAVTADQILAEALAGNIYFNVHSTAFPAGEVRGQLELVEDERDANGYGEVTFVSALDGDQEVQDPPVVTDATGEGLVTFNVAPDGVITYDLVLSVEGVTEDTLTVLHFHNAPAGANGPVVVDIASDAGFPPGSTSFEGTEFEVAGDVDTVDLSGFAEGVFVDLDEAFAGIAAPGLSQDGFIRNIESVGGGEITFEANLIDVENVIGTAFNDRLFGNAEDNILQGRGGNDVFHAFAGNDVYNGGLGTDLALFNQAVVGIDADLAEGRVIAGDDINVLISIENLNGGNSGDVISGDDGVNVLNGRGGDDIIRGREGADEITLGEGADTVAFDGTSFGSGPDQIADFSIAEDRFLLNAADFGVDGDLAFANALAEDLAGSDANVIVLQDADDDNNPDTVFNARSAARLIGEQVEEDGAGFFVYFNSALNLNRLVHTANLADGEAGLTILNALTDLTGEDAIAALPTFTEANFAFEDDGDDGDAFAPVAYYPATGDVGSDTLTDIAGDNDGSLENGAAVVADGIAGPALQFDGVDDFAVVAHSSDFELGSGAVSFWFSTEKAGYQGLVSKDSLGFDDGGHLNIELDNDGRVEVRLQSTEASFELESEALSFGEAHHVVVNFGEETGLQLFVDGVLQDETDFTGGLLGNQEAFTFGASQRRSDDLSVDPLVNFFEGQLDEIAIFDEALSQEEVETVFEIGASGAELPLEDGFAFV